MIAAENISIPIITIAIPESRWNRL